MCVCEVVLNSHRLLDNKQCAAVAVPQELDKVFWPKASCDTGGGGGVAQWAATRRGRWAGLCVVGVSQSCSRNEICSVAR